MTKSSLDYPDINLGIEIEAEGVYDPHALQITGWNLDQDGSLREGGIEMVFDGPARGRAAELRLSTALRALQGAGARASYRTSIHVHCDVASSGLKSNGITRAVALYALVERALFAWEGNSRECNNFCVPLFKAGGTLPLFAQAIAEEDQAMRASRLMGLENYRYGALNLHALSKFNTLEFRHMLTTFDYERVITWINIVTSIMAAANASRMKMQAFVDWMTTANPEDIMRSIFSDELIREIGYGELHSSIRIGRPIALGFVSATGLVKAPPYVPAGKGEFYNPTLSASKNELAKKLKAAHGAS